MQKQEQEQVATTPQASPADEKPAAQEAASTKAEHADHPVAGDVEVATPTPQPRLVSAQDVYDAPDLTHADVPVPEWTPAGELEEFGARNIRLLEMSAGQAIKFTESIGDNAASRNKAIVNIIRITAVDLEGKQLFAGSGAMEKLMAKSFKVYQRLSDAALKLNGFRDEDEDQEQGDGAADSPKND